MANGQRDEMDAVAEYFDVNIYDQDGCCVVECPVTQERWSYSDLDAAREALLKTEDDDLSSFYGIGG